MRKKIVFWMVFGLLTAASLFINLNILYAEFVLLAGYELARLRRFDVVTLWRLAIWSMILPDNYVCTILFAVCSVVTLFKYKERNMLSKTYKFAVYAYFVLIVISMAVNKVGPENIIMSGLYFSSIVVSALLINHSGFYSLFDDIKDTIDGFFNLELFATAVKIIMFLTGRVHGSDWSTGTFGHTQQTQIFLLAVLGVMWEIRSRQRAGKSIFSVKLFAFIIAAITTNCWSLFISVFAITIIVILLNTKARYSIAIAFSIVVVCTLVLKSGFLPENITNQMNKIVKDENYREYRFYKFKVYGQTYTELPKKDLRFAIIGNGMGNYASRAALTCTGVYIKSYKNLFDVSMSEYTKEYIFPRLKLASEKGSSDYGSILSRPNSTFLAIMGETGYLGVALFVIILGCLYARTDRFGRIALFMWLTTCFYENFMEYVRVIFALLVVLAICNKRYDDLLKRGSDENENIVC